MSGVDVAEQLAVVLLHVGLLLDPLLRASLSHARQLLELLVVRVLHLLHQLLLVRQRHLEVFDLQAPHV